MKKIIFVILLALAVFCAIFTIHFAIDYRDYKKTINDEARSNVVNLTKDAVKSIEVILREAETAAKTIADDYTAGTLDHQGMLDELQKTLRKSPYFYAGTVTYRPYGFAADRELYSCLYVREGESLKYIQLDEVYDYTETKHEWYSKAMEKKSHWSEPYYGNAVKVSMTTYSAVFYETVPARKTKKALGVVTIDTTLEEIKRIVESLDLGSSGFGALVSKKGTYLYHPDRELVAEGKNLLETARERNDETRFMLNEAVKRGENGIFDHVSTTTGKESWLVYEPVPLTGWSLQNTFLKDDIYYDRDTRRKQLIKLTLAVLAVLLFFVLSLSLLFKQRNAKTWIVSVFISLLFLVSIGSVWYFALTFHSLERSGESRINSRPGLAYFKKSLNRTFLHTSIGAPVYLPTGIFIESLNFSEGYYLTATGYIWQKYSAGIHDGLSRGFVIPMAESLEIKETFRDKQGAVELIRWRFQAKWRPRLNYGEYPLEQEKIEIKLQHKSMGEEVVLAPDLDAYSIITPAALPGLDKKMVLPGWKIKRTFFEIRKERLDTDFGSSRVETAGHLHNLYFNIIVRRNFLDSFISNLAPLILVSFLLFCILLLSKSDTNISKKLEAGAGKVLAFCAGLFFVVIFGHIDIRQKIPTDEIFYLEYFYLIMYLSLLWVSVNSILFHLTRIKIIQYKENFISKVVYWPVLLGLVSTVTVLTFY